MSRVDGWIVWWDDCFRLAPPLLKTQASLTFKKVIAMAIKGWRTIVFNLVTGLLAGLAVIDPSLFGANGVAILAGINAAGNFVLRLITTTPVGVSGK